MSVLERILGLILLFCNLNISKLLFEKAKNARNHIVLWLENSRKRGENAKMRGVFASKHRTSLRKTTALLMQNLGTLPQRSPMFLLFRRKNALKMPENVRKTADALILRYFGPGQTLVASDGLLAPLSEHFQTFQKTSEAAVRNIAHSLLASVFSAFCTLL